MIKLRYYKSLGRQEAKRLYPIQDGDVCVDCTKPATDHHHIDGNTHNNTADNVLKLCRVCHLRRERKDRRVGSHTRLTRQQINRIKYSRIAVSKLADEYGMSICYIQRIRTGKRNPIPVDEVSTTVVPAGFVPRPQGKPRALSTDQVKHLIALPILGKVTHIKLCQEWQTSKATLYKARGRRGCYADSIYD